MTWRKFVGACVAASVALATSSGRAEIAVEQVTVAKLPPATPYRLYLSDMVISHFVDGRLIVIDGETLQVQGNVSVGMAGHATLSPDRQEILVAATYFTKLNRGERIAELDVYDANTLKLKAEIAVPAKQAQSMPYKGVIRASADGRFVFMQNATPATSVTVVDRTAGKFVAEIPTPGCWMIYPAQTVASRFATLCGDGTVLTVTLDGEGKVADRKKSRKLFDPDEDALFVAGEQSGDEYTFVSFKGNVQVINVGGEEAMSTATWPMASSADARAGWRPGGYQPLALQEKSGRLYVGMHPKGKEGSHKTPAKEIWAFDLSTRKRIARLPGHESTVIAVTRGERPMLYGVSTEKSTLAVYRADGKPRFLKKAGPYAEFGTQLDVQ